MKRNRNLIQRTGLGILLLLTLTCEAKLDQRMADTFERLRTVLKPLDLDTPSAPSAELKSYLEFYSLSFDDTDHFIGTISSGTNLLAVQMFRPRAAKGSVIVSHGYYDHAGVLKHLIGHLVTSGYAVAVLDQPGHGLSTGNRAAIGDFQEYVDALDLLIATVKDRLPAPTHLVGHSMGCSVILDSLLKGMELPVDRIVLLAPLIRSSGWAASGLGFHLGRSRLESVPRKFRRNSSDSAFLKFHKEDPLQARTVPMSWVAAHRKWYGQVKQSPKCQRKVRILQGTKDKTVDWEYNLKFLRRTFPEAKVAMIEGAGHQLMNEKESFRQETMAQVTAGLTD